MKVWDIGGQFQYRQNWIDYAKMANVILYMVDSSNVIINKLNSIKNTEKYLAKLQFYHLNIYSMIRFQ